jgi:iron(III) transport system substrate-binding protein
MSFVRFIAIASLAASLALDGFVARAAEPDNILLYRGVDRQQLLLDGAKQEGQVNIYTGLVVNVALRPLVEAFMQKYRFVKANYLREESESTVTRVAAEEKARNVIADVLEGTDVDALAIDAGLVQPFYSPLIEEYPEKLRDPRGLAAPTRLSYFALGYNTKLVPKDKIPQSYDDLLDPMWQGKMAWRIGTASGTPLFITNLRLAWGEDRAMAYLHKLAGQHVVNFGTGSASTLVDRVVAGEYPLALNVFAHFPLVDAAKGAPAYTQLLDPVPSVPSSVMVTKNLPHPHAAMLFVDFILSKEGQQVLSKAGLFPAHPDVAPTPVVAAVDPRTKDVGVNFITSEVLNKNDASSEKIYQDLFR